MLFFYAVHESCSAIAYLVTGASNCEIGGNHN